MAEIETPTADAESDWYDGVAATSLAERLGIPSLVVYRSVGSTMDVAHALAADDAPPGTVVLADEQTNGRGRQGRPWQSEAGQGIWLTLIERPRDASALDVLSLRVGLGAAAVLDAFATTPVRLKWPNDLLIGDGKLAGVLVEARWRGHRPDYVAIGIGVNVRQPSAVDDAASLRDGTRRIDVLTGLVPAVRDAAHRLGPLLPDELRQYGVRDYARGRTCSVPVAGTVLGVTANGRLAIATPTGVEQHGAGSLVLEDV